MSMALPLGWICLLCMVARGSAYGDCLKQSSLTDVHGECFSRLLIALKVIGSLLGLGCWCCCFIGIVNIFEKRADTTGTAAATLPVLIDDVVIDNKFTHGTQGVRSDDMEKGTRQIQGIRSDETRNEQCIANA